MDRIHILQSLECCLSQCYPTFLAQSDPKMVVRSLVLPIAGPANKRQRCPLSFFRDEDTVSALHDQLSELQGEGEERW